MKILIIEDEAVVARRLIRYLESILSGQIDSLRHMEDLYEGLDYIRKHPIDLLFLDLNLNGSDGFRMLMEAAAGAFQTIIVSAHSDQAIRAFEFGVTDFVEKPYTRERLKKAIERTMEKEGLLRDRMKFLAVREGNEVRAIPVSEIMYIQGADDYSEVHCSDGSRYLHHKTLQELSGLLPQTFDRVHRSYLVNRAQMKGYQNLPGSRYRVILKSEERLPVSRSKIRELRRKFSTD